MNIYKHHTVFKILLKNKKIFPGLHAVRRIYLKTTGGKPRPG